MIQAAQHMIPKYLNATFYSVCKDHVSSSKHHIQPGLSASLQYILKCCHDNLCHSGTLHEMVSTAFHYGNVTMHVIIHVTMYVAIVTSLYMSL